MEYRISATMQNISKQLDVSVGHVAFGAETAVHAVYTGW